MTSLGFHLAKHNPNIVTKGFNDKPFRMPVSKKPDGIHPANNGKTSPSNRMEQENHWENRDETVPAKYTDKEILEMLTEAKYYIIKSSNDENISLSRAHNEWATTKTNEVSWV